MSMARGVGQAGARDARCSVGRSRAARGLARRSRDAQVVAGADEPRPRTDSARRSGPTSRRSARACTWRQRARGCQLKTILDMTFAAEAETPGEGVALMEAFAVVALRGDPARVTQGPAQAWRPAPEPLPHGAALSKEWDGLLLGGDDEGSDDEAPDRKKKKKGKGKEDRTATELFTQKKSKEQIAREEAEAREMLQRPPREDGPVIPPGEVPEAKEKKKKKKRGRRGGRSRRPEPEAGASPVHAAEHGRGKSGATHHQGRGRLLGRRARPSRRAAGPASSSPRSTPPSFTRGWVPTTR